MNIKSQAPTIRSYGTPSVFSGTNIWTVKEGYWYYNGEKSNQVAEGKFTPNYSASLFTGKGSFQKNLELLNSRINTIHKELSYWDLYQITSTVLSPQSFPSIISALAAGNSAVINCETFTYNNQTYHRGDVVVKITDSEEILIQAINTGVFVPHHFEEKDGMYNLHFRYTEAVTQIEAIATGLTIAATGNTIYGQTFLFTTTGSEHFNSETFGSGQNTQIIKPVVKSFIQIDNKYEEIILDKDDLAITLDGSQWTLMLNFKPSDRDIYVQVK